MPTSSTTQREARGCQRWTLQGWRFKNNRNLFSAYSNCEGVAAEWAVLFYDLKKMVLYSFLISPLPPGSFQVTAKIQTTGDCTGNMCYVSSHCMGMVTWEVTFPATRSHLGGRQQALIQPSCGQRKERKWVMRVANLCLPPCIVWLEEWRVSGNAWAARGTPGL